MEALLYEAVPDIPSGSLDPFWMRSYKNTSRRICSGAPGMTGLQESGSVLGRGRDKDALPWAVVMNLGARQTDSGFPSTSSKRLFRHSMSPALRSRIA